MELLSWQKHKTFKNIFHIRGLSSNGTENRVKLVAQEAALLGLPRSKLRLLAADATGSLVPGLGVGCCTFGLSRT
jgi:hypothetical protein